MILSLRSARRLGLALLATLALVVGGTSAAEAVASSSSIAKTNGTRAAEAFFNHRVPGTHGNRAWIDLYDAKCDANPVFVHYTVHSIKDGEIGGRTTTNYGGCGTTQGINLTWSDGYFIVYEACVEIDLGRDVCGPRREERLP